jgi:glucosamine--fructose-6-phosphate aminotransferase (isomerizing)
MRMPLPGKSRQTAMLAEIHEQPAAVARALMAAAEPSAQIAADVSSREIDLIVFAARGTSDHAALYAQYLMQYLVGIPVALATPSLFTVYRRPLRLQRTLVIGVSQSGEGPDIIEVLARGREAGALTLAVTNVADSGLARTADRVLLCEAGPELSVAATKTYTTSCAALAALTAALPGGEPLRPLLEALPGRIESALEIEDRVAQAVGRYVHAQECVVLGRGFEYGTAREAALKLEETCYVTALPFSTADFRHGPAALVERGLPVMLFAPPGPTMPDSIELLVWLREQGADCIVVAQDDQALDLATTPIRLPAAVSGEGYASQLLAPLGYIVPGQLFAHDLALEKGLDPDHPRALSKVTRTH